MTNETFKSEDHLTSASPDVLAAQWASAATASEADARSQYHAPVSRPAGPLTTGTKRLVRPATGRMIGGVCAGIANYMGWDVNVVRIGALATFLLPGPNVLAYLAAWALIPGEAAPSLVQSVLRQDPK